MQIEVKDNETSQFYTDTSQLQHISQLHKEIIPDFFFNFYILISCLMDADLNSEKMVVENNQTLGDGLTVNNAAWILKAERHVSPSFFVGLPYEGLGPGGRWTVATQISNDHNVRKRLIKFLSNGQGIFGMVELKMWSMQNSWEHLKERKTVLPWRSCKEATVRVPLVGYIQRHLPDMLKCGGQTK